MRWLAWVALVACPAQALTCEDAFDVWPNDGTVDLAGVLVIDAHGTWSQQLATFAGAQLSYVAETETVGARIRIVASGSNFTQVVVSAVRPLSPGVTYRLRVTPKSFLSQPRKADDLRVTARARPSTNEPVALAMEESWGCAWPRCSSRGVVLRSSAAGQRLLQVRVTPKGAVVFVAEDEGEISVSDAACASGKFVAPGEKSEVCVAASTAHPDEPRARFGPPLCFRMPETRVPTDAKAEEPPDAEWPPAEFRVCAIDADCTKTRAFKNQPPASNCYLPVSKKRVTDLQARLPSWEPRRVTLECAGDFRVVCRAAKCEPGSAVVGLSAFVFWLNRCTPGRV